MISLAETHANSSPICLEYRCLADVNLYDSSLCRRLATQAARDRHLRLLAMQDNSFQVQLCEDDYPGWMRLQDLSLLEIASQAYQPVVLSAAEIRQRLPGAIAFIQAAQQVPHHYLWGGTVAPNYDCSGLMQAAFAAQGVWIPRDAYQQKAFARPVAMDALELGDLIFFGTPRKATHVGLYLGEGKYVHCSSPKRRNGIGIDTLAADGGAVSRYYFQQVLGAGRIASSYAPRSQ